VPAAAIAPRTESTNERTTGVSSTYSSATTRRSYAHPTRGD
jgi:hypothetical protein